MRSFLSRVVCGTVLSLACLPVPGGEHSDEFTRPEVIRWGAGRAELEKALEGQCAGGFKTRPIEPPFLPAVETEQVQIDCDGLDFMGAPRWVEFVIGDDRLQMVWLMVEKPDRDRIVAAMRGAYGEPSSESSLYTAFTGERAAWREKPPEVLFYAEEIDEWVESFFNAGE